MTPSKLLREIVLGWLDGNEKPGEAIADLQSRLTAIEQKLRSLSG